MKDKTKKFLSNLFGSGEISMMRVLTFFVVVDIMGVWTISCVRHGFDMQEVPYGVAGIFTAVILGKAGQRFAENEKNKKEKEDD
jgi:hypothetical protein